MIILYSTDLVNLAVESLSEEALTGIQVVMYNSLLPDIVHLAVESLSEEALTGIQVVKYNSLL